VRVVATVLAVPVLLLVWQWWGDTSTERRLSPIASEIAGRDVHVDCQTLWGALIDTQPRHGEVMFDGAGIPKPRIFLTHDTCKRLERFAGKSHHGALDCLVDVDWSRPTPLTFGDPCYEKASNTVYAILILAHEAYHTAGVQNEAVANCYATQSMAYAAVALGSSPTEAQYVAIAMDHLLPLQQGPYQTNDCRRGSDLDLHPETPDFPTEVPITPAHGKGGRRGIAAGA
jgi:hypothetical protein